MRRELRCQDVGDCRFSTAQTRQPDAEASAMAEAWLDEGFRSRAS
jgi:hypothetical protein